MKKLIDYITYNREVYLFPVVAVSLLLAGLAGVPLLTGRAVIDDPGAIVGWVYNFCGITLLSVLVGQVQQHFFGYRATGPEAPFRDDVFDACVTAFLFLLFGWLLWH